MTWDPQGEEERRVEGLGGDLKVGVLWHVRGGGVVVVAGKVCDMVGGIHKEKVCRSSICF